MEDKKRVLGRALRPSKNRRSSTGRMQVFDWIKDEIGCEVKGPEDLRNRNIFCLLVNKVFPGSLRPVSIAKGQKLLPHQVEANFRYLKSALHKLGAEQHLEVEKLAKGHLQDCLEFARWLMEEAEKSDTACCSQATTSWDTAGSSAGIDARSVLAWDASFRRKTRKQQKESALKKEGNK